MCMFRVDGMEDARKVYRLQTLDSPKPIGMCTEIKNLKSDEGGWGEV